MTVLGFDTSNYTTSVAVFDGSAGENASRLLDVSEGALGLRQSDALFAHVKRLPELTDRLFSRCEVAPIGAIGVSSRPRAVEGSYMPCFLAGVSQAHTLASVLRVPVYEFSHQQGHIAASLFSAGRMDLMDRPHLAWHLSGGTTELLYVTPQGASVHAERIGGTTDLSAGQLIDRTGQLLGLGFPAGKALDALAGEASGKDFFRVKVQNLEFSLSGVENKVRAYPQDKPCEVAAYALRCLIGALKEATKQAQKAHPDCEVVFAGGVSSNSLLRKSIPNGIFCAPQYSTDNALGTAILAWRAHNAGA